MGNSYNTSRKKNTLTYDSNTLNQYTKLQNLNKNDEVKKEFTYTYDNNGNLSKDDINQYFYDYKNRLVKVIQNEVYKVDELGNIIEIIPEVEIVNYEYDILGRRITKTTQDKTTEFIYAGQQAIQENTYSFSGSELILQETRENIYSNNLDDILSTIITDYTTETPTTNQYYYEKNHLGSITKITDTLGAIIEQYEYDVFGVAYANVNNVEAITNAPGHSRLSIKKAKGSETNNAENSEEIIIDNIRYKRYNGIGRIGNTRLYTGREYDPELKLYYNRARYYSPDLGRFISRDPIDITDDVNLYGYVGNNGVMFVDLLGLAKQLQEDIDKGNSFVIELVARRLDIDEIYGSDFAVHTYIMIYSMDENYKVKKYSIGGHNEDGKLEGIFNKKTDLLWDDNIKSDFIIKTPEGMLSSEFVQNILDEYIDYNSNNKKDYRATGLASPYDTAGNCNNFSSTIIYRASDNDDALLDKVGGFNPFGYNPGIGDYFIY